MCPSSFENLHQFGNLRFDVTDLNSALFNLLDIEKFEADHPELFPKSALAQAREQIAELKRQIEKIQQENQILKEKISSPEETQTPDDQDKNSTPKTIKASEARQQKAAQEWAESLEAAVALAVECARADKPKSTEQHRAMWRKQWPDSTATEPRKGAFAAFRRGLPDDMKGNG